MGEVMHLRRPEGVGLASSTACGLAAGRAISETSDCTMFAWSVSCPLCVAAMSRRELQDRRDRDTASIPMVERRSTAGPMTFPEWKVGRRLSTVETFAELRRAVVELGRAVWADVRRLVRRGRRVD